MIRCHWKLAIVGLASMLYVSQAKAVSVHPFGHSSDHGIKFDDHKDKDDHKEYDKDDKGGKKDHGKKDKDKVRGYLSHKDDVKCDDKDRDDKDCRDLTPKGLHKGDKDKKHGWKSIFDDCGERKHKESHEDRGCDKKPPCHAVPLPPAAWTGMLTMAGAAFSMRKRFRFLGA